MQSSYWFNETTKAKEPKNDRFSALLHIISLGFLCPELQGASAALHACTMR